MKEIEPLTTSKLARESGVHLETIRFYEKQKLLPKAPRTKAGYRIFTPETVQRVRFVKRAQALGFTLKEIRELLSLRVSTGTTCATMQRRAEAKAADIDEKIRHLKKMKKALEQLTETCKGRGPTTECPILEALQKGEYPG
jgi:MerR family transcriptional regulator, copper efflux regulator